MSADGQNMQGQVEQGQGAQAASARCGVSNEPTGQGRPCAYVCKYTPVELLVALGADPRFLESGETDFEWAESLTHANLCSHAKAVIQQARGKSALLTDCCDSLRRAYDALCRADERARDADSQPWRFLMDLPHEGGECGLARLERELHRVAASYVSFVYGADAQVESVFNKRAFCEACRKASAQPQPNAPFVAVMGARASVDLMQTIQDALPCAVVNLTCSQQRELEALPSEAAAWSFDECLHWYAQALVRQIPCMRMAEVSSRKQLTENPHLAGIVYNTVKFCDYYGFDYAELKKTCAVPVLKIETDFTFAAAGQISTRLEAFAETLSALRGLDAKAVEARDRDVTNVEGDMAGQSTNVGDALFAGIDSGSTTTNMVVIDADANIVASAIVRTGAKAQNGAAAALAAVCDQLGVDPAPEAAVRNFRAIVATGYGRANIPFATSTKTEITCHARGVAHLDPSIRTIVDIGGQDSKVICLDETGAVKNFIMNDKCAAGTGRFLEAMARTLELDLPELAQRGLDWKRDLTISSMCTVFAESEVISLIADNNTDADIIHGLNKSVASKTASMVARAKGEGPYMMTGGVARNDGVVHELEQRLGAPLTRAADPDLCGAIGAALFARD